MATPTTETSSATRFAITLTGVFLASMVGTFVLWATLEPDCSRAEIAAFESQCADTATTP